MCKGNMSQADVCEECADKCMLIHKKKRNPSSIVSSCLKVMIKHQFFRFLPLPPRFTPRLASLVGQETWVEDTSGRKWTLTLSTVDDRLGFGRGWNAFSLEHGIELNDFLIIHYILDSHFVVQIYGKSGCEKQILPSPNNTTPNKRSRTTADSVGREDGRALKKSKELLDEPCLMMVNRDTATVGEEERITLYDDVFVSEISNIKHGSEVDRVQKEIGSSNAESITYNRIMCADALKNKVDDKMDDSNDKGKYEANLKTGTSGANGDLEMEIMHLESATNVEIPEQLHNVLSKDNDMLLDYEPFEDLLGDPLDVRMGEFNEKGDYEFQWTSEIVHNKKENDISTENSTELQSDHVKHISGSLPVNTDLPFSVPKHNVKEMHTSAQPRAQIITSERQIDGNNGKSILKEPASAMGGIDNTSTHYTSAKGTTEPNITGAGLDLKVVKAELVDHTSLQASCLVTPNSESFLEIPKGLPTTTRAKVEVKVVVLLDSSGRRWPVIYHDIIGLKGLGDGWGSFSRANGIKCGDECVFMLEDQFESMYRVQVNHK
ncbi:hypothetical protein V2J09_008051 [Rumex salicifolius]